MIINAVLPCLDEAAALPWVLERMPAGYHPIVADNGSTDGSPDIARSFGATVIHVERRGYGAACHAGLLAARAPVTCVLDADGSLDPRELPAVTAAVLDGSADLVLGRRKPATFGAWPLPARAANGVLVGLLRRRTGLRLRDLGPMRAFRLADMLALGLLDRRFGYPLETVLTAHQHAWRITEVPVGYQPRSGRSKVSGTITGWLRTASDTRAVLAR
jgi:glycosyltransferase involved in cell wall biosynthesis